MPYPYVDIRTAPYIYYATLNTFECFKMHCNVSQWLVTHLQRVQWMKGRYTSWEMTYFTAFSFGCTETFFQTWIRATCLTSFQSRPRGSRAFRVSSTIIDRQERLLSTNHRRDGRFRNWLSLYADCLRSIFYCYLLSENHLDGNSDYWRTPSSHKNNLWLADKNVFITCK